MRIAMMLSPLLVGCTSDYALNPEPMLAQGGVWDYEAPDPDAPDEPDPEEDDTPPDLTLEAIDVALIIGYQCVERSGGGDGVQVEVEGVEQILDELGVGVVDVFSETAEGWDGDASLFGYDAVLYTRCGWQWQGYNAPTIDALFDARAEGVGVLFFGDDSAFGLGNLTNAEDATELIGLQPATRNGNPTEMVMEADALTMVLSDDFAAPETFAYRWDIDITELAPVRPDVTVSVLARRGDTSSPSWIAQTWDTGGDTITLLASVTEANHGPPSDEHGLEQLRRIFAHSLSWVAGL
ncbi:MAG: hypothetical protein AAFV53_16645 [Myxococcota bacterium]